MSALAMNWALRDEQVQAGVHGVARSVLVVLADHANAANEAWPSLATLVAESGWSERAVSTALAELEAAGLVIIDGWRQRCRLRRLAITTTSAPPADVAPSEGDPTTSAPHAEVDPTSAPPAEVPPHDFRTTSAPPAPEPLTGTVNSSAAAEVSGTSTAATPISCEEGLRPASRAVEALAERVRPVPRCEKCGAPLEVDEDGDVRCTNGHTQAVAA